MKWINWFKENYWLAIILVMGAGMRFYHIDYQSLWLDEVLSMNDANPNLTLKQCYDSVMIWEAFPHMYFYMLKFVVAVFGYTSLVARLFSAAIGIFGVYAMYLLGRELFSKKAGLIAAAITAANVFHLFHSQEVRPYGMLFLFTALSFYRVAIFIRKPGHKNAIYYAVFAGLMVNTHFLGFTALAAQALLLLFFLIKIPAQSRKQFFIHCLIAGAVLLVFIFPTIKPLKHTGELKSFWVPELTADSLVIIFKEFFGNAALVVFAMCAAILYYFISFFRAKLPAKGYAGIVANKWVSSGIILFAWLFVTVIIPVLKSYLDVSIMLTRYFINVLPAIIILAAIGLASIRKSWITGIAVAMLLGFSFYDIIIVKDYYNAVSKTQLRELCADLKTKNPENSKLVITYSWIFPYYLQDTQIPMEGKTFEDYVSGMRNNAIKQEAFWYADCNVRPYALSPEDEAYLIRHFILKEKLEYYDAWANYYVPKTDTGLTTAGNLDLRNFKPVHFDDKGNMMFFNNTHARSLLNIAKGSYNLIIKGNSLPARPIKNENAHLRVRINGKQVGDFFMSEDPAGKDYVLPFEIDADKEVWIQLIYDNDILENGQDRNVIIYSAKVEKK